ncbi:hypothetical protein PV10_06942 [Exophiala mesophila]|uniref:Uncharacterized protein n=1 Tax=Exophiala mesophila TaxID=212818 RepID=A0A0D1Z6P4_EXOME|nr:uncharacterized protein PV10_06942 [Exophiala mesophila]KIV89549.1 hypothetical protein PV10_06942 [Exophiala mesophila]
MRSPNPLYRTLTAISLFLSLSLFLTTTSAKSTATSFCKCICFNNSTIIALNPPSSTPARLSHPTPTSSHRSRRNLNPDLDLDSLNLHIRSPLAFPADDNQDSDTKKVPAHHKLSCADCTRAFCLDYNLPICKNAEEEDVFTSCFQRDSLKDETVVVIFIFGTAGLLAWALVKPWIERLRLGDNGSGAFDPLIGGRGAESRDLGNPAGNGTRTEGRASARGKNSTITTSAAGYGPADRDGSFRDDDDEDDNDPQDLGNGTFGPASNSR